MAIFTREASHHRYNHDDDGSQRPAGLVQGASPEGWSVVYALSEFTEGIGRGHIGDLPELSPQDPFKFQ